ncbi:MAG: ABC transporter ATP-binding protein [Candidatus Acidiferrum sp.]
MLRLIDLTKAYDADGDAKRTVLAADRLNLEVKAGEVFGLVGPNGAGKSTALKMICGLLLPTSGRVFVNNVDVELHREEAQRYLGYLADFFSLYDELTVYQYLEYFAGAYKLPPDSIPGRILAVIMRVGLESKRDSPIAGLSRGMKQRLGIARAVIHDPPLLVLDEPAAGLDPKARHDLKQLLRGFHDRGRTIVITSHVLPDLEEICTSIGILEKGRLIRVGKIEEILQAVASQRTGAAPAVRAIRIRLSSPGFALESWLTTRTGVSRVATSPLGALFEFTGNDTDFSELVKALVTAGAPLAVVEQPGLNLEEAYSRIAKGEVM